MAITNHDRVGKAMELLKGGLGPFVEREMRSVYQARAFAEAGRVLGDDRINVKKAIAEWDVSALLKLAWESWNDVFRRTLGPAERSLVSELRDHRNRWAHQEPFSSDDAYRALDSAGRLLTAVSAPQAAEVEKIKMELLRLRFDEQVRGEKRKAAGTAIESVAATHLKPWREVVTPHPDVASGRYQQAEFAADLWQVHLDEGADEYRKPLEFYRRTYLTESLKRLLSNAMERLSGKGGDPVVQLQTNFGGGKTHSMLALYHLFSGTAPTELAGVEALMKEAGIAKLPEARRVVLVGNKISPGNPVKKSDGTEVRTLWGELAWQLGFAKGGVKEAKKAFQRVAADDAKATSPGDVLRDLFKEYGPALILIDEWVAYARQLHDEKDVPGGSFETQFSFAQVLTESAKLAGNCLLVISLPASDTGGSAHASADDVEVGGLRGREALDRLRNVIGRLEAAWRPASAEEGFEIVRRRLFEPMTDPARFKDRDVVARAFADFYRSQHQEFPPECRDADYETRLQSAYPIHPEVFDRLYTDWSTLVKFQRTRGVLRLMAAVIHSLWEKGDRNPLILPANIPIDDPRVESELTRQLSENWTPVIQKDVDGPGSLPLRLDSEVPNLGKYHAGRRVARTIFLGSAPTTGAAHQGLEDRRVKLGCAMPGETPAVFGDALRRLAGTATYLYQDGPRYWYSTQPTVTKLAEDRAELLKRDPDKVIKELEARIRADVTEDKREKISRKGDFSRVHPLPQNPGEVPDDHDARLVILGIDHPYSKEAGNPAETEARLILGSKGSSPRLFQNALVFLATDKTRLQDLDEAVRRYLAWDSILDEQEKLNLSPSQVRQAETQRDSSETVIAARLPETYRWLIVPEQATYGSPVELKPIELRGSDALAVRAGKKLRGDSMLAVSLAPSVLRMHMDRVPLWRGDHVSIKQLVEDFARYPYLPRLRDPSVLLGAIRAGLELLIPDSDGFAYADSYDESTARYRGLRISKPVEIHDADSTGLLAKPEVARRQLDAETRERQLEKGETGGEQTGGRKGDTGDERSGQTTTGGLTGGRLVPPPPTPKRFHGTVTLDPTRVGRDAGRIAEEVIVHLSSLLGAKVNVTLEINAELPNGAPEQVVRTVTENSRTLKFTSQGFEKE
jgi:predicted AAA+ superfamily ATPase